VKFTYQYRTSDNARHRGVIAAADRDAAFALLKERGIRAFSVEEAPGVFNKLFGKGKRWLAIGLLAAAAAVLVVLVNRQSNELTTLTTQYASFDSGARRQLIGDPAVIELGIRTGWATVFAHEGDQFLASFAIPGVFSGRVAVEAARLREALACEVGHDEADSIEVRQLKHIVAEMKREINALVADGWTLDEVGDALVRRQREEVQYRERAQNEVEAQVTAGADEATVLALWQQRNAQLRAMGIATLPMP